MRKLSIFLFSVLYFAILNVNEAKHKHFTGSLSGESSENTIHRMCYNGPDPDTDDIFNGNIRNLINIPYERIFSIINRACSAIMVSGIIKPPFTPDPSKINLFLLKSATENYSFPLVDSHELWSHSDFNHNLKTVIVINGWTSDIQDESSRVITDIAKAYFCRGGYNVIALDPGKYIKTLYTWSSFNTELIGELVAETLVNLVKNLNYSPKNIHVIGLSLGGQIAGSIGRYYFNKTNDLIGRITGLDPANPCFNEGETLNGLSRGDAEFVDVIHTNSGALGKRDPIGDIDFYPNGISIEQPGCTNIICAHIRSFELYAESVYPGNEMGFLAVRCSSIEKLNKNYCKSKSYPMGFATPTYLKGSYFLNTNSNSPYGKHSTDPNEIQCSHRHRF